MTNKYNITILSSFFNLVNATQPSLKKSEDYVRKTLLSGRKITKIKIVEMVRPGYKRLICSKFCTTKNAVEMCIQIKMLIMIQRRIIK